MTTLAQLYTRMQTQPLRDRVVAEFVRFAGEAVRNPSVSPERKTWAANALQNPEQSVTPLVMNVFYTNTTVSTSLDNDPSGEGVSDNDLAFILNSELLPLIAPA